MYRIPQSGRYNVTAIRKFQILRGDTGRELNWRSNIENIGCAKSYWHACWNRNSLLYNLRTFVIFISFNSKSSCSAQNASSLITIITANATTANIYPQQIITNRQKHHQTKPRSRKGTAYKVAEIPSSWYFIRNWFAK